MRAQFCQILLENSSRLKDVLQITYHTHILRNKNFSGICVYYFDDLLDEIEISLDGMIRITHRVHFIQYIDETIEKELLEGDVLTTNERTMSARQAMSKNESRYKDLGVKHKPEGLHRQFV